MNGTILECIAWLSQQKEGTFDVTPHVEEHTDPQIRLYWQVVRAISKVLREPPAYVHNYNLRLAEYYDGTQCKPVLDTDEAELKVMYDHDEHYKPTHETFENFNGVKFRLYRKLRGIRQLNVDEMSMLIDIAIGQMNDIGAMLPRDEATLKAYEEHKKGKK